MAASQPVLGPGGQALRVGSAVLVDWTNLAADDEQPGPYAATVTGLNLAAGTFSCDFLGSKGCVADHLRFIFADVHAVLACLLSSGMSAL
jgi:hypothetical protein